MAVTAEGVFRIIDKASDPIKKIKSAAIEMDKHVQAAGKKLDDLDSPKVTQSIKTTEKNTKSLGDATETMGKKVQFQTERVGKSYEKMAAKGTASLEELTTALKRFEHERATAQVDVDIAKAEAKIRLIKHEIRTFTTLAARKELDSLGLSAAAATAALAGAGGGGGGGGSPGGLRGGLAGGFFAAGGRAAFMGAALLAALPAIVAVTGAVSALVGSLGAAVGGVGALGIGTLGMFATGLIAIVTVARPAIKAISEQKKAQDAYNKSVQQYGRDSAQAAQAQKALAAVNQRNPGTATFNRNRQVVGERFRSLTGGARRDFMGILNEGLKTANSLLPTFARVVNQVMDASRDAVEDFMRPFRGREWKGIIATLGDTFSRSIGPAARSLGNIALFFGRIAQAASPLVIRMFERFESWTKGLADGVSNQARAERGIGKLVGHLRDWVRMGGAAVRLMGAFFGAGAGHGQTIVQGITEQLNKWTEWLRDNPAAVENFFDRTIESTGKLVHALGQIAKTLGQIGDAMLPVLNLFSDLTTMAGNGGLLGPLAAMGGARLLFGKRMGGVFGRGGGGGAAAGGAAAGAAGAAGATAVAGRSGIGRLLNPGAAVRGGARALGRVAAPLALGMAAWDFATYRGNIAQRGQAALSGATFGLIPRPVSGADQRDRGQNAAAQFVERDPSLRHTRGRISALQDSLAARDTVTRGGGLGAATATTSVLKLRGGERERVQAQLDALRPVLKAQVKIEQDEKAMKAIDDLMLAFDTRWQKAGSKAAQTGLIQGIRRQIVQLGPDGDKALLSATARWTSTMENGTKAQRRIAERTKQEVVAQFKAMGRDVRVINGDILDISRSKWGSVRAAITTESERARQEGRRAFTDLQRAAFDALRLMGFGPRESKGIIQGIEKGGNSAKAADYAKSQGPGSYQAGVVGGSRAGPPSMPGAGDGIGIVGKHMGDGPGQGRRGEMGRQGLMGASPGLAPYAADAAGFGLSVTSGLRPGAVTSSGNQSWHSKGRALDLAGSPEAMLRFFRHAKSTYGSRLEELIYTPGGAGIKNGKSFTFGGQVAADHYDHVHLADAQGARGVRAGTGGVAGAAAGGAAGSIRLPGGKSAAGGVLGEASKRAQDIIAAAMGARVNAAIGGGGASAGGGELDRIFPRHIGPKRGAAQLSPAQVMAIAQSAGLPGRAFEQIAHGESSYYPGIQQPDPGDGMVGYGLWQMTPNAWGRDSAAYKHMMGLGGIPAMFNPYKNAQMAKFLYDAAGKSFSPWYGTRYLTAAAKKQGDGAGITADSYGGGKVDFGGWYGNGGAFTVHRPTLIGVGDGPGSERVTVKPSSHALSGKGGSVNVHIEKIVNYEEGDIQKIVERELAAVAANLDFGPDDDEDELG